MYSIAIDGPSGAGKSTVADILCEELGFVHVDTGAMYRTIGLYLLRNNIDPSDEKAVSACLGSLNLNVEYIDKKQHVYLNGEDVTPFIRTNEVSTYASKSSALKPVRDYLLDAQRNVAKKYNVIMDGRDIGTVILPKADVKFFMSASTESRAHRRHKELLEKGEKITYEEVLSSMLERDKNDSSRKIAPAIPAEDSIPLDNSGPIEETIEFAKKIINERIDLTK